MQKRYLKWYDWIPVFGIVSAMGKYAHSGFEFLAYMQMIADRYNITPDKPFNGIFYFETINKTVLQ